MKYTHYKNRFSSKDQGVTHIVEEWNEIVKTITDKSQWHSFTATDKSTYDLKKQQFDAIVMAEMRPNSPRQAENVIAFYAIVLDIDDGVSYDDVRHDLQKYEYVMYSSGGTGLKHGDRFRVILPLNVPMPATDWKRYNTSLSERFPYSDECFKKGIQIQYLPVVNTVFADQFIAEHHRGEWFDYQNPNDLPFVETQSLESITKNVEFDVAQFTDTELQDLARAIVDHQANSLGYEQRRLLAQRLKHIGMTDFDAIMVLDAVSMPGFSTPNSVLVQGANPLYAHPEGLYKHIAEGVRIPALERRIVRAVTSGAVLAKPPSQYDGEWTLGQQEYINHVADGMDFSEGVNLLIADVGTGKTVYWTDADRENIKFIAPLTSIVSSIGDVNSLTSGDVGTWNQIEGIINTKDKSIFKNMTLVVDECHGLFVDYGYKAKTINRLIDSFKYFKSVVLMSGTVEVDYFSSMNFNKVYRVRKPSKAVKNIRTFFCTKKNDVLIKHINNLKNKTIVLANDKKLCETIQNRMTRNSLVVTADKKNAADVQAFYKAKRMDGIEVLIGTNSIVEGLSIEDDLRDVDIVIWSDTVPERIEQFCNRFRNVSAAKNVWYFVDRKGVEVLDTYERDDVLVDAKNACEALQSVYEGISSDALRRSFIRQFNGDISKDLMYFHDGRMHVSFTGVDYEYALHREKQYRNNFGMLANKLREYGFNVFAPVMLNGDAATAEEIKKEMQVVKAAYEAEREHDLRQLITDIAAGQVKRTGVSEIYTSTYESLQKLITKGLAHGDVEKVIVGYIDDETFFAKAHGDADYVATGETVRELVITEIKGRSELQAHETQEIAEQVIDKVLREYFAGDVTAMSESRSWGGLVVCGSTYPTNDLNILVPYVLPLRAKSGKAAKEILSKYIKVAKSKMKSINGKKVRVLPIDALSLTGLTFNKPSTTDFTNPAIRSLKARADALKPIVMPEPVEVPKVVNVPSIKNQTSKLKNMIKSSRIF